MWLCGKCRETVESSFEACWNCGTSKDGVEDPAFRRAEVTDDERSAGDGQGSTSRRPDDQEGRVGPLTCLRCSEDLEHLGTKRLQLGTNRGLFGDLSELFGTRERFDVYVCPRCGRIEFFVDDIGARS